MLSLVACVLCRSAQSEDTISSIQGSHPKKAFHAAHPTHFILHNAAPRRKIAAHTVSRPVRKQRFIAHRAPKTKTTLSALSAAAQTPVPEPVKTQSIEPTVANYDALSLLKSGLWRDGMSVFPAQQTLFRDDFGHPESNGDRWTWAVNDGQINSQNDCLELSAKGHTFPVIQTLNDPFPSKGDWTVSIGYRYTGARDCGTSLKIARLDGGGQPDLAVIHEDNNGQFLTIDGAGQVWRLPPNKDWHILTMVKQGNHIQTIMDGKAVATMASSIAPVGFRFGNTVSVDWLADWTSQQIRFVEVTAPHLLLPDNILGPDALHWTTTDGYQYLEASSSELHLKPRFDGAGPHNVHASSKIDLPRTKIWRVSFDIRFGGLKDQASSFHLTRDGHDVGWVGADGFYKQMGVFTGKDREYGFNADLRWHHLSYTSSANAFTVELDGKQIGSASAQDIPDSVNLSNGQDLSVPCHQGGVWVRNVKVQSQQGTIGE